MELKLKQQYIEKNAVLIFVLYKKVENFNNISLL